DDLPAVPLERLERFLMVALAPAMAFDDVATPLRSRVAGLPFADLTFDPAAARDYLVEANWALYVDNYLEGFHIPYVHSSLAATRARAAKVRARVSIASSARTRRSSKPCSGACGPGCTTAAATPLTGRPESTTSTVCSPNS